MHAVSPRRTRRRLRDGAPGRVSAYGGARRHNEHGGLEVLRGGDRSGTGRRSRQRRWKQRGLGREEVVQEVATSPVTAGKIGRAHV